MMLKKCGLLTPTIKRFFVGFAIAFACFFTAHADAATVLRLDKGGVPTPMPKPHRAAPQQSEEPAQAGPALSKLSFVDAEGQKRTLAEFKGTLVLLNLWATWCSPCVREMPDLSQLARDYKGKGMVVVTISQDTDPQKVRDFFSEHGIDNLPLNFDPGMKLFQSLGARGLPVTVMIDPQGKEITRFNGFVEWMDEATRRMLEANLPKETPQI